VSEIYRYATDDEELVCDNFAGSGGVTEGIEQALEELLGRPRSVDIAINHSRHALETHMANHPKTLHLVNDILTVDPVKVCHRDVGFAWFSPDCRHHSRARGSAPVSESVRDLAWVVIRWARTVRPRVIGLENVREFQCWGPVLDYSRCKDCKWEGSPRWKTCKSCRSANTEKISRPDKSREGETFNQWKAALFNYGYNAEFRILNAADYGAPTTRKRLFMIARCDGDPIVWPEPTHFPPTPANIASGKQIWRAAAEVIDWRIPVNSIFDRKKPLADKTQRRIALGIKRYVLDAAKPFIVPVTHQGDDRVHSLDDPMRTITAAKRGEFALVSPLLAGVGGRRGQSPPSSVEKPLPTVTGKGDAALVAPTLIRTNHHQSNANNAFSPESPVPTIETANGHAVAAAHLVRCAHGDGKGKNKRRGSGAHDLREALPTQTQTKDFALASAHLMKMRGDSNGHPLTDPVPTITSGQGAERPAGAPHALGLCAVTLAQTGYGEAPAMFEHRCSGKPVYAKTKRKCRKCGKTPRAKKAQPPRTPDINKPLGTVVSGGQKHAMVSAFLAKHYGDSGQRPGVPMEEPVATITQCDHHSLVAANLLHLNNNTQPSDPTKPLHTVTSGGNHAGLAAASLIRMNHGDKQWHGVHEPLPVVTSQGNKAGLVYAWLSKFFGTAIGASVQGPMPTVTTKDRFGLVTVEVGGETYAIVDIGMRMLEPHELALAQGFPAGYKFLGPKYRQVAHIGNSVSPPVARALVAANFRPRKIKAVKSA
jgi:DNA (cytosine-5)-methyltransferase 1